MNKPGPVLIIEECGCKVDHGIPTRCAEHKLTRNLLQGDMMLGQYMVTFREDADPDGTSGRYWIKNKLFST